MNKKTLIVASLLSLLVASGCNSNQRRFAWQEPSVAVTCQRFSTQEAIEINSTNMALNVLDNKGCFNSENPMCDIRIYQVMVESFAHGKGGAEGYDVSWGPSAHHGNIKGIIENLDYIKSTGVNALWLTPIFETKVIAEQSATDYKLDGTGYYTSNYFKIDPKFGTLNEVKQLVNLAHKKGMYVFFDGVFGHVKTNVNTVSALNKKNKLELTRMCRDITGRQDKLSLKIGSCTNVETSLPFLTDVAKYWIKELKIDGWRLDQAYQLTPAQWKVISDAVIAESAKSSNAYVVDGVKKQPLGYMVAEVWTSNPIQIEDNVLVNKSVVSAFNFPLREQLLSVLASTGNIYKEKSCSQPASSIQTDILTKMRGYSDGTMMNNFIGNHDVPRFGDLLQRAGYENDSEKSQSYMDAHKAAFSFLASLSGPITMYYGEESGDEIPNYVNAPANCAEVNQCEDHVSRTTGHTANLTADESKLKDDIKEILTLRDTHPSLSRGKRTNIWADDTLLVDVKQYKEDNVLYVFNSGSNARKITVDNSVWEKLELGTCTYTNLLTKESIEGNTVVAPAVSGSFFGLTCTK